MTTPLRLGIAGLGTVGVGIVRIVQKHAPLLATRAGRPVEIVAVSARSKTKNRDVDLSKYDWEDDPVTLARRDDIDVFIEVMGGHEGPAKDATEAAMAAGKDVVSANKALLAIHGQTLAEAAEAAGRVIRFEAAVAGGIPVIKALTEGLAGNDMDRVMGVMNGTCNYILTRMERTGADFQDVLAEAQAIGFAEADPTADVEGLDVQAKIAILAKLAFGETVVPEKVPVVGISSIEAVDFEYANLLDSTIRLLGTASTSSANNGLSVFVYPHVVKRDHASGFASARGPTNAVSLVSEQLGVASLVGAGAGRFPTARSVVADVMRVVLSGASSSPFPVVPETPLALTPDFTSAFYVRISARDQLGIIKDLGAAAERRAAVVQRAQAAERHEDRLKRLATLVPTKAAHRDALRLRRPTTASKFREFSYEEADVADQLRTHQPAHARPIAFGGYDLTYAGRAVPTWRQPSSS